MNAFPTAREAKEFLVARILEEAQREGVSLSDVERKTLYFSESYWTLPDVMAVNDQFDQDYDQEEYEKKIANLIRSAAKRTRKEYPEEYARWLDAIRLLNTEDHYILVLVARGGISTPASSLTRPLHDRLKLWGTGVVLVGIFLTVIFIALKYDVDPSFALWATLAGIAVAYGLFALIFGASRANNLVARIIGGLFGSSDKNG